MPKTAAAVKEHQARGHPSDEGGVDERHVDVGTRAIVQDDTTARVLDEHVRYAQLATIFRRRSSDSMLGRTAASCICS